MRSVCVVGGQASAEEVRMRIMMAERFQDARIVVVDERQIRAPIAPAPKIKPISDPAYINRAKAAAAAKRARKGARRVGQVSA